MSYLAYLKKEMNAHLKTLAEELGKYKDPDFFAPFGTQVHCGRQGSGKTISAVHTVRKIKSDYPKAILVSNMALTFLEPVPVTRFLDSEFKFDPFKQYVLAHEVDDLHVALTQINNDFRGVIYLIDEIHTYFNALQSKDIPMHVFTEISQQRKQRKLIIGTSQLFMRMAKPLREQCDLIIMCKTFLGHFTKMDIYDAMTLEQDYSGHLIGTKKKTAWFAHTQELHESFDTFQKIVSSSQQFEEFQVMHVSKKQALRLKSLK